MTQVAREGTAGFWIASGGPKSQFSTGWHPPAVPPQSASVRQGLCGLGPLQAPAVGEPAPAGGGRGGTVLARRPPMSGQEAPRSLILVVQAGLESTSPETGAPAGVEKPAPPQAVVPAAVVYLSESPVGQVVVVVLD